MRRPFGHRSGTWAILAAAAVVSAALAAVLTRESGPSEGETAVTVTDVTDLLGAMERATVFSDDRETDGVERLPMGG